ncbi:MAG: SRPBCC domain-containing protein [Williamsia herbipolensis]|nr:SRPBCC domain-containing protein [Williamsia herbipolensis]
MRELICDPPEITSDESGLTLSTGRPPAGVPEADRWSPFSQRSPVCGGSVRGVDGTHSTRVSRTIRAPRSAVYRALLDPVAYASWRVPDDMSSVVHEFTAQVGGRFRVSLSYDDPARDGKSAQGVDKYHGRFVELVPDERVVEEVQFESDDAELLTPMTMTTTLRDAEDGTEIAILHEGLPAAVSAQDNVTGTRMSLDKLARWVESGPD